MENKINEAREKYKEVQSRLIGASVRNGEQVAFLAGLDVLTIPPPAMEDFLANGGSKEIKSHVSDDITPGIDSSNSSIPNFFSAEI